MTARLKVALLGGAAVVASTAIGAWAMRTWIARDTEARVRDSVRRASRLAERSGRLRALERAAIAASLAVDGEFVAVFARPPAERAGAAFVAIEGHGARLQQQGRKADLLLVVDADGKVIARDLDPRALFGEDLASRHPAMRAALGGDAQSDVWLFDDKLLQVSLAPVRVAGQVAGAILVGYGTTSREARAEADVLGADVAYFLGDRLFASSLAVPGSVGEGGEAAEDVERTSALQAALLAGDGPARRALGAGRSDELLSLELRPAERRPERYVAAIGKFAAAPATHAGMVVLTSLTESIRVAQRLARVLLGVGLLSLLALLGSLASLGRHFEKRLDAIELGVSEVISGNTDATFQAFDEFEGLCNGLNVMLARLLGRPEPGAPAPDVEAGAVPPEEPGGAPPAS